MRVLVIFSFLILLSCGRPLTPTEAQFITRLHGGTVDTAKVRLVDGALIGKTTFKRQKRPRLACRERIFPEPTTETVTAGPAAIVLHNRVFFAKDWFAEDYLPGHPEQLSLVHAMLFAHEITHVWQWQNRKKTGYSPLRAAREHGGGRDPYLFDISTRANLLDYAYEQQASIVEEYVCCVTLDPDAPRTHRLKRMLSETFPLQDLQVSPKVYLPWDGVQIEGICR